MCDNSENNPSTAEDSNDIFDVTPQEVSKNVPSTSEDPNGTSDVTPQIISENIPSTSEDPNGTSDVTPQIISENNPSTSKDPNVISDVLPRVASCMNMEKAVELIRRRRFEHKHKRKHKGRKDFDIDPNRYFAHTCVTSFTTPLTKINASSAFYRNFSPMEMRNALQSEDWPSVVRLFLMILKINEAEPIIWRYAFLIFLRSSASDHYKFEEFVKMCRATDASKYNTLLEKLLSLSTRTEENK